MTFDEMAEAMEEARKIQLRADGYAEQMAQYLVGRLIKISPYTARKLKRELRKFNMTTTSWSK